METNELSRKLLEVACRIRFGELSHKDNELVDQGAHALNAALDEIALLRAVHSNGRSTTSSLQRV
jgi:hypothetical protein